MFSFFVRAPDIRANSPLARKADCMRRTSSRFRLLREQIEKRFPFFDKTLVALVDYMTIRDLLELSGYADDAPLFDALLCMFDTLGQGSLCMSMDKKALARCFQRASRRKITGCTKAVYGDPGFGIFSR